MTDKTYHVRFACRDGSLRIYIYDTFDEAMDMYDLFDESYSDVYTEIQLIERDWTKDEDNCDTILHRRTFE